MSTGTAETGGRTGDLTWRTPVVPLPGYPAIFAKLENLQYSGSFKIRGAARRLSALTAEERTRGVVACSSGNHGRAVAEAAAHLGIPATVVVPSWADDTKTDGIRRAGARLVVGGDTYDEAEIRAAGLAEVDGLVPVHPFDDPHVIAGQGTVAQEVLVQCPDVAEVVVPLSGGGLVGGIARVLAERSVAVTAVSAERAAVMHRSVEEGRPVTLEEEPTLASALSGGIGLENEYTFALVRDLVQRFLLVSEGQIRSAVSRAALELKVVVEGGGAVGLAAVWAGYEPKTPCVIIVSGGNIAPDAWLAAVHED
ncbi:MAG: pyridoxal-phosphate dependent enzyme [Gemmatimonadetes bacterium]|nr:pyridoxal-phosphate dependent enzyme [Gemmatimonadota bacterium]